MAYDPFTYTNNGVPGWGTGNGIGTVRTYTATGAQQIYGYDIYGRYTWLPYAAPSSGPGNVSTATGVSPLETSYALYGHTIPLSVFGIGRIGGEIIAGPWVENGAASFCISFGLPADPTGTRTLKEIAFDSQVVWTATGGFASEAFTYRFYGGTLTQAADPLEILHFGANAVAYRPQMLIWFQNLPLSNMKFRKIPYVAAVIADSTGDDVNLGEAFERLAYSPYVGYTSAQFETIDITDGLVSGGLIITEQTEFLDLIQRFGRFYGSWDILQTDKLRIVDRGNTVTPDVVLNRESLIDEVIFSRAEPNSVPRVLELATIDPDSDYTIVPSRSSRPRDPVAVSASVRTESAYLPAIMDSQTRQAMVTYTTYREEVGRKRVSGTAMIFGFQLEPGDLLGLTGLGGDFRTETFKVMETLHGANYTVEFTAQAFIDCDIVIEDPALSLVVLLMGFEGINGSQSAPGLTDESPAEHGTAGAANAAAISTSQSKFGVSSLSLTGTNPKLEYGASADWRLATTNSDQFTVESWVRLSALPSALTYACIVSQSLTGVTWDFSVLSTGEFRFRYVDTSSSVITISSSAAGLGTGTWYHLAVDKDAAGKIRVYKDGVMLGSSTPSDSGILDTPTSHLVIGAAGVLGGAYLTGNLDELRITKGLARYASDGGYVVPTDAYPRET